MQLNFNPLIIVVILVFTAFGCQEEKEHQNLDEIFELCNKSLDFAQNEILTSKCPPPLSDKESTTCPDSYVKFCDLINIVSELAPYRYAIGVVIDEPDRAGYLREIPEIIKLNKRQISTYNEPSFISKSSKYEINEIGNCILQIDYPLILNYDAWVGVHWIGRENYSEYLLKFRKNQSDGAWRFVSFSTGGYS